MATLGDVRGNQRYDVGIEKNRTSELSAILKVLLSLLGEKHRRSTQQLIGVHNGANYGYAYVRI